MIFDTFMKEKCLKQKNATTFCFSLFLQFDCSTSNLSESLEASMSVTVSCV